MAGFGDFARYSFVLREDNDLGWKCKKWEAYAANTEMNEAVEDEIRSIEAIYPDIVCFGDEKLIFRFADDVRLDVVLPPDYPIASPPRYLLSGPSLSSTDRLILDNTLNDIYLQNLGEPILHLWIEMLLEYQKEGHLEEAETSIETEGDTSRSSLESAPSPSHLILSGDPFTDRKSTFQAHIARVHSPEQVREVLAQLKLNNKIARATHNIVAFRVRVTRGGNTFQVHDCDDDGETGAAAKMLAIMERMQANNVVVVVTRWYGGVHLGPDRFRIINNLTRQIIVDHPECYL